MRIGILLSAIAMGACAPTQPPATPASPPAAVATGGMAAPSPPPAPTHRANRVPEPDWAAATADPAYCSTTACSGAARFENQTAGRTCFMLVTNAPARLDAFCLGAGEARVVNVPIRAGYCIFAPGPEPAPQSCWDRSSWILVRKG